MLSSFNLKSPNLMFDNVPSSVPLLESEIPDP